mmetsp:Transcript_7731/g.11732  ORF Transcript_7731/g.11732 Transcript_7731/m.11732 type:complete len:101 (+) Transcript_7731:4625-4927(+)
MLLATDMSNEDSAEGVQTSLFTLPVRMADSNSTEHDGMITVAPAHNVGIHCRRLYKQPIVQQKMVSEDGFGKPYAVFSPSPSYIYLIIKLREEKSKTLSV